MNRPISLSRYAGISGRSEFACRAAIVLGLVAAAALIWYAAEVFLLAFAGILLAVFLDFLASALAKVTKIRRGWAFFAVAGALSFVIALAVWETGPRIANQLSDLVSAIPGSLDQLRKYSEAHPWSRKLVDNLPDIIASADLTGRISALLRWGFRALTGLVVVIVVGLYLGADPGFYRRGLLQLVPDANRKRAEEILAETGYTLRWWIIGQLVPMCVLGVATTIGLYLMHVPLALTLGLFTGVMIFIPYIGSVIAWAITSVVVLSQGFTAVFYVTLLFIVIHVSEGYLLTPLVQRRAVYLPPGLTILCQVLMGVLLGFIGFALATPLTAAGLVFVQMLYLHSRPQHHA